MLKFLKPVSILLIVGMMCLPGILCVYYEVAQFQVREEMEEKLEHEKLQQILIPVTEIKWHEEGKEILVNGCLFDIKTIEIKEGIAYISGLYDMQESVIKDQLKSLQQKQEKEQNTGKIAYKWTSQTLYSISFDLSFEALLFEQAEGNVFKLPHFPESFLHIVLPPPDAMVLNS